MPRINLRHERPHMGRQPAGRTSYIRSDGTRQHHRLTREERAKCRSLYQEGMDKEEIATEIDCAEPTVTRAVNNEYAHPDNLESDEDYLPSPSRLKPAIPVSLLTSNLKCWFDIHSS
ncbi:hypothetical protein OE88DRAFT_887415 [Heliocybe sulcata]|uniref:Uncharacterized protein n=1 Tax=Heliocybe sulcata TaxID=5364 RepID=A0A5C3MPA3_9AGAM|nr:hypothetical protein OE88DRAFT_887415 [Heliocybe sulcata]